MSTLFFLLFLASSSAFLLGLIKPKIVFMPSRKRSSLIYSGSAIACIIGGVATAPEQATQQTKQTSDTETQQSKPKDNQSGSIPDKEENYQSKSESQKSKTSTETSVASQQQTKTSTDKKSETDTKPKDSKTTSESQEAEEKSPDYSKELWKISAHSVCRSLAQNGDVVNKQLNPSEVSFYPFESKSTKVTRSNGNIFKVASSLDTENNTQLDYTCEVQHFPNGGTGGDWSKWKTISLEIEQPSKTSPESSVASQKQMKEPSKALQFKELLKLETQGFNATRAVMYNYNPSIYKRCPDLKSAVETVGIEAGKRKMANTFQIEQGYDKGTSEKLAEGYIKACLAWERGERVEVKDSTEINPSR